MTAKMSDFCTVLAFSQQNIAGIGKIERSNLTLTVQLLPGSSIDSP
ncbi:hypothetical protein [Planktothricoides raciborskii]|uniref:Uncharacterized protein n=1 Tax=Planktothricoides raciborskii GIHE-MW2 TaxID=2792601 RepID=A0AAU8JD45_9CYAN